MFVSIKIGKFMGLIELTRQNLWIRNVLDLEADQILYRPKPLSPSDRLIGFVDHLAHDLRDRNPAGGSDLRQSTSMFRIEANLQAFGKHLLYLLAPPSGL